MVALGKRVVYPRLPLAAQPMRQRQESERALAEAQQQAPIREELLQLALADLRRGGAAARQRRRKSG